MSNNIYKIYSNCIPVKGNTRSIIYDLNRCQFDFIPNKLFGFLKYINGKSYKMVSQFIDSKRNAEIFKQYLQFLQDKEYIYLVPKQIAKNFIPLNDEVITPNTVSNCLIKVHTTLNYNWSKIFKCIIDSGSYYIEFHFYILPKENDLLSLISYLNAYPFKEIGFVFHNGFNFPINRYKNVILGTSIIRTVGFSCVEEYKIKIDNTQAFVHLNKFEYKNSVRPENFSINIETFLEAKVHNIYFLKKLILSDIPLAGHGELNLEAISNDIIRDYIDSKSYEELQSANKDNTLICKSCEFRYMCMDGRTPQKNANNEFYFDEECNYNPYLCKWSNEADYLTLGECGIFVVPDKGVIVNKTILSNQLSNVWS